MEGVILAFRDTFATSADNPLDGWIPFNLFKYFRAILPIHYTTWRESTRRSFTVVWRLLGLDQMWSWDLDDLVAMAADTLLLSCLLPPLRTWINRQPIREHELNASHLTSPQCSSCTCRVCDPFAKGDHILETLDLKHWSSCQAEILKSYHKTIFSPHWGSLEFGWVWGLFGFFFCMCGFFSLFLVWEKTHPFLWAWLFR